MTVLAIIVGAFTIASFALASWFGGCSCNCDHCQCDRAPAYPAHQPSPEPVTPAFKDRLSLQETDPSHSGNLSTDSDKAAEGQYRLRDNSRH
jgi:hypothetical protein